MFTLPTAEPATATQIAANIELIRLAELKKRQAEIALAHAQAALEAGEFRLADVGSANTPAANEGRPTAWGPVMFSIVDTLRPDGTGELKLEPVKWTTLESTSQTDGPADSVQREFDTAFAPKKKPSPPKAPKLTDFGSGFVFLRSSPTRVLRRSFDRPIVRIDSSAVEKEPENPDGETEDVDADAFDYSLSLSQMLEIRLNDMDIDEGSYNMTLEFSYKVGDETKTDGEAVVEFEVR